MRPRSILIAFWLSLIVFLGFSVVVSLAPFMIYPWDVWFAESLQYLPTLPTHPFMRLVSGPGYFFIPTLIVFLGFDLWLLRRGRRELALWLALNTLFGIAISGWFKHIFQRPRPSGELVHLFVRERGFSFPSGHVVTYVAFYGTVFLLLRGVGHGGVKVLRAACAFLVLFVGLSRVYLGAHWLSDVLASYALGTAMVSGFYWLLKKNNPAFSSTL